MEHGEIVERGRHEELYAVRGRYFDLYTKQHGLESNLFLAPGEGDATIVQDRQRISRHNGNEPDAVQAV